MELELEIWRCGVRVFAERSTDAKGVCSGRDWARSGVPRGAGPKLFTSTYLGTNHGTNHGTSLPT
jgi:hypothetical protein